MLFIGTSRDNDIPPFLIISPSIIGPIISPMGNYHKRLQKIITPIIEERKQKLQEFGDDWADKPVCPDQLIYLRRLMCVTRTTTSCASLRLPHVVQSMNHPTEPLPRESYSSALLQFIPQSMCISLLHTSHNLTSHSRPCLTYYWTSPPRHQPRTPFVKRSVN